MMFNKWLPPRQSLRRFDTCKVTLASDKDMLFWIDSSYKKSFTTSRKYEVHMSCTDNVKRKRNIPFIDQIFIVLSIPQLAMRYISEGWKS